jgi:hypothetical protein
MTPKQEAAQARKERRIFDYIRADKLSALKAAAVAFYNPDALTAASSYDRRSARIIQQREKGFLTFTETIRELIRDD